MVGQHGNVGLQNLCCLCKTSVDKGEKQGVSETD